MLIKHPILSLSSTQYKNESLMVPPPVAKKILIPVYRDDIAPRFDLATEVVIAGFNDEEIIDKKVIVLPGASAESLCHFILSQGVEVVICGGIEQEHYDYLTWKNVQVFDSVIGRWKLALEKFVKRKLESGAILLRKPEER